MFLFHVYCTPVVTVSQRVFTENDISDREKEEEILFCVTRLIDEANLTQGVTLDELTEIVVNVDSNHKCHYYFVDHTHRLLFWLVSRSMEDLNVDLQGIAKYSHISMSGVPWLSFTDNYVGYIVESHYWYAPLASLSGLSVPVAFHSATDPNSSISHITWNRGPIVNTTPTIAPFQMEPSKTLEGCSIISRLVHLVCEIPTLCSYRTTRHDDY